MTENLHEKVPAPPPSPRTATFDRGDIVSLSVAGLSLLVALASLLFSIKSQYEAKAEYLAIEFSPHQALDEGRLLPFANGVGVPGIFQEPWGCMLSNNGDRTISIVEHEVWIATDKGKMFYSHISGGFLDREGSSVPMPVVLEPGQSRLLYLSVGLLIDESAATILAERFGGAKVVSRREVEIILAKAGLDLYGNERSITQYAGGEYTIAGPGPDRKEQVFVVVLRTGRGHLFSATASLYAGLPR